MRNACALFLALALCGAAASGQGLTARFVTSLAGWEQQDTIGSATQHLRGYGNLQLSFSTPMATFQTSLQGSTDLAQAMENDPQLRLFNLTVRVKNIADRADLTLGRMAVFGGVNFGSIDGALLRVRAARGVEIMGYGGGVTPPSQRTDFFHNVKDNWQAGGHVLVMLEGGPKIGLSYMNRHREFLPYESFRYDPQNGVLPATIDYGSRANQYASLEASYGETGWWSFARADYDLNFDRIDRVEFAGTWQVDADLGLSLSVAHRQPTIAYNSYFALLESEANQEIVLGADYRLDPLATVLVRASSVFYEGDKAYRVSAGVSNLYGSVLYTKDLSFDGDLDGFQATVAYPMLDGRLTPHLGATYSSYALADGIDKTTAWAGVAGFAYRPFTVLSIDAQGQYMNNRIFKSDLRGLVRISYLLSHIFSSGT